MTLKVTKSCGFSSIVVTYAGEEYPNLYDYVVALDDKVIGRVEVIQVGDTLGYVPYCLEPHEMYIETVELVQDRQAKGFYIQANKEDAISFIVGHRRF